MPLPGQNRRQFLGRTLAAAGAGFAIGGTKSSGRVLGANDAVRVAVVGLNGRGGSHVGAFAGMSGVEITHLVDPDTRTYAERIDQIKGKGGSSPRTVQDLRRVLDDPNVDAVSVATPNHWHALATVWSCQAGKDVYVEKPCSHNVHEGRVSVEAARKYVRVVQHGTQGRSMAQWANLAALIKEGRYGKLRVSRGLCYKPRPGIGTKPDAAAPPEVDFNLWLGPAPERAFNTNLVHYNWHWFWDFGNGDVGNQGVHQMDVARWMIPGATLPTKVVSLGGRFGEKDQGETANTQVTLLKFGDTDLIFEVRGLKTGPYLGEKVGNTFHFDAGVVAPTKAGLRFFPKGKPTEGEPLPKARDAPGGGEAGHFANFIAAVRSRKTADLKADILEGHYSSALCHLTNVSYRLGRPVPFDAKLNDVADAETAEAVARMKDHLADDNGLSLDGLTCRLGRTLTFDPATESFPGDPEANALLTRDYRKPFAVPDKIA